MCPKTTHPDTHMGSESPHVCMKNTHTHRHCAPLFWKASLDPTVGFRGQRTFFCLLWKPFSVYTFPTWPFTSGLAWNQRPWGAHEQVTAALFSTLAPPLEPPLQLCPLSWSPLLEFSRLTPVHVWSFFSWFPPNCSLGLLKTKTSVKALYVIYSHNLVVSTVLPAVESMLMFPLQAWAEECCYYKFTWRTMTVSD